MLKVLQKVLKPGKSYTQPPVCTYLELLWKELERFNTEMELRQRCTLSMYAITHCEIENRSMYINLFFISYLINIL